MKKNARCANYIESRSHTNSQINSKQNSKKKIQRNTGDKQTERTSINLPELRYNEQLECGAWSGSNRLETDPS